MQTFVLYFRPGDHYFFTTNEFSKCFPFIKNFKSCLSSRSCRVQTAIIAYCLETKGKTTWEYCVFIWSQWPDKQKASLIFGTVQFQNRYKPDSIHASKGYYLDCMDILYVLNFSQRRTVRTRWDWRTVRNRASCHYRSAAAQLQFLVRHSNCFPIHRSSPSSCTRGAL